MTAPDARQSDELRAVLAAALQPVAQAGIRPAAIADALLPAVTAWHEKAAEAQARARAAEERWRALREAADVVQAFVGVPPLAVRCLRERETTARALAADDRTDPA